MSTLIQKNKVLLLGEPDDIHTLKWVDGWHIINYKTEISGISNKLLDDENVFFETLSSEGGNGLTYLKYILKFRNNLI